MGLLYVLIFSCVAMAICSIIWAKKSRCKHTSLYERDLMYNILDRKVKVGADIIQKLAFEDELTGLYNKRKFLLEGNLLLQNSGKGQRYALMYMAIDKLSFINNIYGSKVRDAILKQVASQMAQLTSREGLCCRTGEGEFALLFPVGQQSDVMLLYESLVSRVSKLKIKNNINYRLELVVGVAIYPEQANNINELYENATFVMKDIKAQGSKTLQIFDSKLKESILHREILAMELQEAINHNEFILYYQPKVDAANKKLVGMEALIRWKHPKHGFMAPGEFIPIAEQTRLIIEIGKWGLIEACLQNKIWQNKGYDKYVVSVNISAIEFYQENMLDLIKEALQIAGLEAKYLEIELTESMALIDKEQTINKLNEIKALGIKIALDDFGTGYSSLSYLKALPIDVLKLDRSFVIEIEKDDIGKNIILAMIELAKILNIETVAEGVETKEQAELLEELGCNMIQGYYYSRPLPPDIFEEVYMKGK